MTNAPSFTGTIYMATLHTDNFAAMKTFYQETLQLDVVNENGEFIEFASKGLRLSLVREHAIKSQTPLAHRIFRE